MKFCKKQIYSYRDEIALMEDKITDLEIKNRRMLPGTEFKEQKVKIPFKKLFKLEETEEEKNQIIKL